VGWNCVAQSKPQCRSAVKAIMCHPLLQRAELCEHNHHDKSEHVSLCAKP
jgi:hypothetical protein